MEDNKRVQDRLYRENRRDSIEDIAAIPQDEVRHETAARRCGNVTGPAIGTTCHGATIIIVSSSNATRLPGDHCGTDTHARFAAGSEQVLSHARLPSLRGSIGMTMCR